MTEQENFTPEQKADDRPRIGIESKEWISGLDVQPPIDGGDIPGFTRWVNWHGYSEKHQSFDFSAYLNDQDELIIGLPENTPVCAVANGQVAQIVDWVGKYGMAIRISHGIPNDNILSGYDHVVPVVKQGQRVKKGEIIGHLYKDSGNEEGRLVHLHLSLQNYWKLWQSGRQKANPEHVFNNLDLIQCRNPESLNPELFDFDPQPKIIIANFKKLRYSQTGI